MMFLYLGPVLTYQGTQSKTCSIGDDDDDEFFHFLLFKICNNIAHVNKKD